MLLLSNFCNRGHFARKSTTLGIRLSSLHNLENSHESLLARKFDVSFKVGTVDEIAVSCVATYFGRNTKSR